MFDVMLGFKNYPVPLRVVSIPDLQAALDWCQYVFGDCFEAALQDIDRITIVFREEVK